MRSTPRVDINTLSMEFGNIGTTLWGSQSLSFGEDGGRERKIPTHTQLLHTTINHNHPPSLPEESFLIALPKRFSHDKIETSSFSLSLYLCLFVTFIHSFSKQQSQPWAALKIAWKLFLLEAVLLPSAFRAARRCIQPIRKLRSMDANITRRVPSVKIVLVKLRWETLPSATMCSCVKRITLNVFIPMDRTWVVTSSSSRPKVPKRCKPKNSSKQQNGRIIWQGIVVKKQMTGTYRLGARMVMMMSTCFSHCTVGEVDGGIHFNEDNEWLIDWVKCYVCTYTGTMNEKK